MNVHGKVVLVTGASGALGEGVVTTFAAAGARLVLVDRKSEPAPGALNGIPDPLFIGGVDVTDPAAVRRMAERAAAERGRIDALLNLAGGWRGGTPLHETSLETWGFLIGLNARSVFLTCQAVIPIMIAQGYGKIVNVAARTALQGAATTSVYSASKAMVIRLTESMAAELKDKGINVNCVLPSLIDNPANRADMPKADFSKWVSPEAMADVLLFLASDASRAIHGAAIPVFGRV
jgi:NAD(P)-dependent dehydrogenase (short-subunit alcohol dehydrogenase family)